MDLKLERKHFSQLSKDTKIELMHKLAQHYALDFISLEHFERDGQSCETGVFKKSSLEFVFVPGSEIEIGLTKLSEGFNQDTILELEDFIEEYELDCSCEQLVLPSMRPLEHCMINPMIVSRSLLSLSYQKAHLQTDSLKDLSDSFKDLLWKIHKRENMIKTKGEDKDLSNYLLLLKLLANQGFSLPTAQEWSYLCGGGCRTIFACGDNLDYNLNLRYFEENDQPNQKYDLEEPNFFGIYIGFDPYKREIVEANTLTYCGGDGGCNVCGGLCRFLGYLPCSVHYQPQVESDREIRGEFDFIRPIIRIDPSLEF